MRKLVTVRPVKELIAIEGADLIELARVDGWQCVVKKGDFGVGDNALYFEIDSLIPSDDERFAFLSRGKVQSHYRIKSMKLRGALSQGLLMPLSILTAEESEKITDRMIEVLPTIQDGSQPGATLMDVADILGVQKYEPPMPTDGKQHGSFPTHLVPKTDQERIQNIPGILEGHNTSEFEITEKLDGTSCTFYYLDQQDEMTDNIVIGACSRNWEMKLDDDNVYAKLFHEFDLEEKLIDLGMNLAIQGEVIGPRIQGNKYKCSTQEFYVFDIYDIDAKRYLPSAERVMLVQKLGLKHVPHILYEEDSLLSLDVILELAEGNSMLHDTQREGLVFKEHDGSFSFKVVSNKFLLKHE